MIGQLENLLVRSVDLGDLTTFNPHRVEELAKLLVPYYAREGRHEDVVRLLSRRQQGVRADRRESHIPCKQPLGSKHPWLMRNEPERQTR